MGTPASTLKTGSDLTGIGKQQGWIIQRYGGGGVDIQMVVLLHEEVQEGLPDLLGCLCFVHPGLFNAHSF